MISQEVYLEDIETPILIGRLGVPAAEPLGLYGALSTFYDADLHSPVDYGKALFGDDQPLTSNQHNIAYRHMLEGINNSMDKGRSVVCDALLNKPNKRAQLAQKAAKSGYIFALIRPETPIKEVHTRLKERVRSGQSAYAFDSVGLVLMLDKNIRNYCREQAVTSVPALKTDGTLPVGALIAEVDAYIRTVSENTSL